MNQFNKKQQGAALIVGLVMLAILTVLTASSMNASTVSLRMVDNIKQRETAHQAAESALSEALVSVEALTIDTTVNYDDEARPALDFSYDDGNGNSLAEATVDTLLKDRLAPPIGGELNSQQGAGGTAHQHFELRALANAARGSASEQRMGFYILAPR